MTDEKDTEQEQAKPPEEQVLYAAHPAMFRNRPLLFLLVAALIVAPGPVMPWLLRGQPANLMLAAIVGPVALGALILLVWWISSAALTLTVTDRRTILRRGILGKYIDEIYHHNVRTVQVAQRFWQRVFGVGTIQISSSTQSEDDIQVHGIRNPDRIRELIDQHNRE